MGGRCVDAGPLTCRIAVCAAVALASLPMALALTPTTFASQTAVATSLAPQVDAVFARWTASTPGCAVGVATDGAPALAKGYGMADLEHDVKISPDTIFEAGSVSKQFTAAAVLLLAREHKLSLDDQARKYIPELPEYPPPPDIDATGFGAASPKPPAAKAGPPPPDSDAAGSGATSPKPPAGPTPLTIRHMLTHTSGLRDWGSVAGIGGWPRTTRVNTHAHVLEIVSRQRDTNFTPGTNWSYSNTGFNLAAIIVQRVSGMPFQEFTRTRLFEPLGMTHTSWRDDYTRIVKGRAMAYNSKDGEFHTLMPFENVYGNGGLLTTVGDLLKWNENFVKPIVGDASFVAEQQRRGTFTDGRSHGYGLGLFIGTYRGVPEVYHSGSTAGYQAFLTRFPDQRVSVAVLCNSSGAAAGQYARAVADLYLGDRVKVAPAATTPAAVPRQPAAGLYRSTTTGLALTIGGLIDATLGRTWAFDGHDATAIDQYGTREVYERVPPATDTPAQLAELAGTYVSDEAEAVLTAAVDHGTLVLKRRPDTVVALMPSYKDAFTAAQLGTVIFRRDTAGKVTALSVVQDRVWDLRFARRMK